MKRLVASIILTGTVFLSLSALADNSPSKRELSAPLEWTTLHLGNPVVAYRVLEKNSSSFVLIHVNTYVGSRIGSGIQLDGCSGESNLVLNPGESYECRVKYGIPLVATSITNNSAVGFVQYLQKSS